ncbi:DUF6439 family protein [Egbenema bharatensis]|uniref:DUF6439 family protein n=1 Tax=Egbenema bharatensis TaxID=3463334 RepID=UPI003A879B22
MMQNTPTAPQTDQSAPLTPAELAQALVEQLAISPNDWHRLKSNRKARAAEQAAVALVYLLNDQPEEALLRLQQASGWLDRSIVAPPCPTHGHARSDRANPE